MATVALTVSGVPSPTVTVTDFSPAKDLLFADDMLAGPELRLFTETYERLYEGFPRPDLVIDMLNALPHESVSLRELTLARVREFIRQPEALFWVFGFPVLMAIALGLAFRSAPPDLPRVAVVTQPGAAAGRRAGDSSDQARGLTFQWCCA